MDSIIRVAPDETLQQLFMEVFKPQINALASDDIASFCTQRLLERLGNPDDIEFVADQLLQFTKELISLSFSCSSINVR
jgi:hypothetical protein